MIIFFFFLYDEETDTTIQVELEQESDEELEFLFNEKVRKTWNHQKQELYLSVTDVIGVLTDSSDPKQYIKKIRSRDPELNARWGTICTLTTMKASDGKKYKTNASNIEGILRIIQSIPSKKAEPFKHWLAQVGKERLEEIVDPELAIERSIATYRQKGYSEKWIEQRLHAIDTRKQLTYEWKRAGLEDDRQYAALTNTLTKTWSGKTVMDYKKHKGLHKENLRDNMTNVELALNQLAEVSATVIAQAKNPKGYSETKETVIDGGTVAGNARKELEARIGQSVISPLNAQSPEQLDVSDN